MREILFRGKRIDNGDWVYGSLLNLDKSGYSFITPVFDKASTLPVGKIIDFTSSLVDPETVGQYTGMTDKNGKKIFEHDIMEEPTVFHNGKIQIPGQISEVVMEEGIWFVLYQEYAQFLFNVCDNWEIIGNTHDNPELIGGMQE